MDMLVVQGGTPLQGEVEVSGSKNAALPIMAASLAASGPLVLRNVPDLVDVRTQAAVLHELGVRCEWDGGGTYRLQVVDASDCLAPYELVRRMRASVCVLGPLLARRGRACVSLPGGCNIGFRPIDLHLRGLAALGADIRIEQGYVIAEAGQLRGALIDLSGPCGSTVTGTCNVLTAASLAQGTTVIDSAAQEPEVVDLAMCLNRMGARIEGAGTSRIVVQGVSELSGAEHSVIPDRIEAATLLCAGAATQGDITLSGICPSGLTAVIDVLASAGATVESDQDRVRLKAVHELRPVDVEATPYPGVPTDVQAQITAVLTQADGTSRVCDRVFPGRFMHLPELCRLGARIRREGSTAIVHGRSELGGASVMACDLRASAALVIAALTADGESRIHRIYHLDRGYERLEVKLTQLKGHIRRETDGQDGPSPLLLDFVGSPEREGVIPPPHFVSAARFARRRRTEDIKDG